MAAANIGADEQELPLFHPSPCPYYVQSPSAASHTLSHPPSESMALILSPFPDAAFAAPRRSREEASRLALSRYSSSRGSNNSFLTDKKPAGAPSGSRGRQALRVLSGGDDDADGGADQRSGDPEAPCCCVAFQVAWRVAVSVATALLVFVAATRPRHPGVSFKVGEVERFSLGEGLDGSGVITSFLDCNCSVEMEVENHSKVFSLHLRPPLLEISFGHFTFATSRGEGSFSEVGPRTTSKLRLFVAAREKPMYAAGRGMEDMLESGQGMPLTITVRARSRYRVVGSLVSLTYRHDSRCVVYLSRTPRRDDAVVKGSATCSAASSRL